MVDFGDIIVKSKIVLEITGLQHKFPVNNFSFSCSRVKDFDGQPASPTRCNEIKLTMESSSQEIDELLGWMASNELKNGKVTFKKRKDDTNLKILEFTNAFIFDYQESFDEGGTGTLTFAMCPSSMKFGEKATVDNEWVLDSVEN
jgi:hypothetical protein